MARLGMKAGLLTYAAISTGLLGYVSSVESDFERDTVDITDTFYNAGDNLLYDLGVDAQCGGSKATSDLQTSLDYALPALVGHGIVFADASFGLY